MNKLECVICDLDGSILDSNRTLNSTDLNTIKKLKEKGIKFLICTGRPFTFTKQVISDIGKDTISINCNGAYVYDYLKEEVIYHEEEIAREDVLNIYKFCKENSYPYMIYALEGIFFDNENSKRTRFWMKQRDINFKDENKFDINYFNGETDNLHFMKVIHPYVPDDFKSILDKKFNLNERYEVSSSEKGIINITSKGINKGHAVEKMSKLLGFDLKNTLILGDNYNDESMLKIAGYAVVPSNGEEAMKKLATFITSSNDEAPLTNAIKNLFPEILD
ncbi:MAG: HAD family hydrolase [Erysipelotrichaceae bacterium]|nr:HAD family hydrolase [Erysipelotrichaceae bacterium]